MDSGWVGTTQAESELIHWQSRRSRIMRLSALEVRSFAVCISSRHSHLGNSRRILVFRHHS
jgi:hypothetical protein